MRYMFIFFVIYLFNQTVNAKCGSQTFNSWNILGQNYPAGAEAMQTNLNWIDENIYTFSDDIFGKIRQMIMSAKRHVYIQTWYFGTKTKPALYLADAIKRLHAKKVKENDNSTVHIWLLINIISLQNEISERKKFERFVVKHGLKLDGIKIHLGFFKAKLLGANHAKTVSVDNTTALITGANFSNSNNQNGFFDLGFVVKGDVVHNLDYDFIQTWISFVKSEDQPKLEKQRSQKQNQCLPILFTRGKANPKVTSKIQKNSLNDAIIASVRNAKHSIDIVTPNLNVTKLLNELAKAAYRGVKVRIILSKGFTDFAQDLPTRGGTNPMSIVRLQEGLAKHMSENEICKVLKIHWYSTDGIDPIDSPNPPANHAKFMLVDKKISFFGSANMDNQSWVNSREIALFVDNSSLAKKWTKNFFNPIFERSVSAMNCPSSNF